jgi:hypothetical protein
MSLEQIPQQEISDKERRALLLEAETARVSNEVNQFMLSSFGVKDFVHPTSGRIDMEKYISRQPPEVKRFFEGDIVGVKRMERMFSENSELAKQNRENIENGKISDKELTKKWKKEIRLEMGHQVELLAMVLFNKFFSKEFVIVRAAKDDDYGKKIDMILADKETGAVICAFDDVIGFSDGKTVENKSAEIEKRVGEHGASLKYGFKIEKQNKEFSLLEIQMKNLPIFYLQVSPKDFYALFDSVIVNNSKNPSNFEIEIMENILRQMESQSEKFLNKSKSPRFQGNIQSAITSINKMKAITKKEFESEA